MNVKIRKMGFGVCAVIMLGSLSGCATIVGDSAQSVQMNSGPAQAKFVVKDEAGTVVAKGTTPQSVMLPKSDGSYFGGKDYSVTFCKEGYQPTTLPIKSSVNGWYIAGNLGFGWGIGWFLVDPFNGGMYTLKPGITNAQMLPNKESGCEGVV